VLGRRIHSLRILRLLGIWFLAGCQRYQRLRATSSLRRLLSGHCCRRMRRWSGPRKVSMSPSNKLVTVCLTEMALEGKDPLDLAVVATLKTAVGGLISLAGWSST